MTVSASVTDHPTEPWLPLPADAWDEMPPEWRTAMSGTAPQDPVEPDVTPDEEPGDDPAGAPDPTTPDIAPPSPPEEDALRVPRVDLTSTPNEPDPTDPDVSPDGNPNPGPQEDPPLVGPDGPDPLAS